MPPRNRRIKYPQTDVWEKDVCVKTVESLKKLEVRRVPTAILKGCPSLAPAVPIPHQGQSINPKPEDYMELAEAIVKRSQKEKKNAQKREYLETKALKAQEQAVKKEEEESEVKSEDGMVAEGTIPAPSAPAARKTRVDRNKDMRKRQRETEDLERKNMKSLTKQINMIGQIKKDLDRRAQKAEEKMKKKTLEKATNIINEARGSVCAQLIDEKESIALRRSSALRTMEAAASAVSERMASMVKRGVAPRVKEYRNIDVKDARNAQWRKNKRTKERVTNFDRGLHLA